VGQVVPYARIVREAARRRALVRLGRTLGEAGAHESGDADELIERFGGEMFGIAEGAVESPVVPVGDILPGLVVRLGAQQNAQGGATGLDTGFARINKLTGGWQRGTLVVIAARPSLGKTTIALNTALHAARSGAIVYFVSAEMNPDELCCNLVCNVGGISSSSLRTGALSTIDLQRMGDAVGQLQSLKILFDGSASPTPMRIRSRAKRLALKHRRLDLVVVDYLQLVRGPRAERREQEVSAVSRELKQLACELGCPVIALAQLNRAPDSRKDKRPRLTDLRESGAIEQDADVVVLLHERERKDGNAARRIDAIIDKNRNGPRGTAPLQLIGSQFRFEEAAGR
jgi:replicative DNA helicase